MWPQLVGRWNIRCESESCFSANVRPRNPGVHRGWRGNSRLCRAHHTSWLELLSCPWCESIVEAAAMTVKTILLYKCVRSVSLGRRLVYVSDTDATRNTWDGTDVRRLKSLGESSRHLYFITSATKNYTSLIAKFFWFSYISLCIMENNERFSHNCIVYLIQSRFSFDLDVFNWLRRLLRSRLVRPRCCSSFHVWTLWAGGGRSWWSGRRCRRPGRGSTIALRCLQKMISVFYTTKGYWQEFFFLPGFDQSRTL